MKNTETLQVTTPSEREIAMTRVFNAPRGLVFDAWTRPELLKRWLDSNWSSLLSVWDYVHRTMVLNVPHSEITIGVPAYEDPSEVTIGKVLLLPFRRQRRDFHLPDGSLSLRTHVRAEVFPA